MAGDGGVGLERQADLAEARRAAALGLVVDVAGGEEAIDQQLAGPPRAPDRPRRCRRSACCRGRARRPGASSAPSPPAAFPWRRGRRARGRPTATGRARRPSAAKAAPAKWARARSMLSPPTSVWLPTAMRRSDSSPSSSVTPMRVKSVVPPPTSQTSSVSPTLSCLRQSSPMSASQAYSAACGSSSSTRSSRQPGRQRRLARQLAGAGVERGRHGQHDLLLARAAHRGTPPSTRPPGAAGSAATPRPAKPSARPAGGVPRAGSAGAGPPCCAPATTWPPRRCASARPPPACWASAPTAYCRPLLPRQIERAAGRLLLGPQVEERRQHVPRLDRPRRHELRDRAAARPSRLLVPEPAVGQHAVGRAEVDADGVLGRHGGVLRKNDAQVVRVILGSGAGQIRVTIDRTRNAHPSPIAPF